MGKLSIFDSKYFQIFIAILIPNLGGIVVNILLIDKFKEREEREKYKSFLELPSWVNIENFFC
jgi:hypothetical protein